MKTSGSKRSTVFAFGAVHVYAAIVTRFVSSLNELLRRGQKYLYIEYKMQTILLR